MKRVFNLHLNFLRKGTEYPFSGKNCKVKLYDQNIFKDAFIGEADIDDAGHAIVPVHPTDYKNPESLLEMYPDLYFKICSNGEVIYKSPLIHYLHKQMVASLTASDQYDYNLGTFVI